MLAAGAWSADLMRPLGLDLQVKPMKGQMLLAGAPPDFCRRMILDGESYLIPRADGRILIGSTLEDAGFDKTVTIRGEPHTVFQALVRGVTHAAYHTGQIMYLVRLLRPEGTWLTVAPGQSRTHQRNYLQSP